jgi:hypothetical protein
VFASEARGGVASYRSNSHVWPHFLSMLLDRRVNCVTPGYECDNKLVCVQVGECVGPKSLLVFEGDDHPEISLISSDAVWIEV